METGEIITEMEIPVQPKTSLRFMNVNHENDVVMTDLGNEHVYRIMAVDENWKNFEFIPSLLPENFLQIKNFSWPCLQYSRPLFLQENLPPNRWHSVRSRRKHDHWRQQTQATSVLLQKPIPRQFERQTFGAKRFSSRPGT